MNIKKFTISNFKKFMMAGIKTLDVSIISDDVILILGTNGSGKSSLINELIPTAIRNNIFIDNHGEKILEISQDEDEYLLESISSGKRSIIHSFSKNGEELNINGTYSMQKELIEKHLNITDLVKSLLTNSNKLSLMTKSQRKMFFTRINPHDLVFLLGCIKKVNKQCNQYKANIKHLQNRGLELKDELLSNDQYQSLVSELKQLKDTKQQYLYVYNYTQYEYENHSTHDLNPDELSLPEYIPIVKEIYAILSKHNITDNTELIEKITRLQEFITNNIYKTKLINNQYDTKVNQTKKLVIDIEELEQTVNDSLKKQIKENIEDYREQLKQYIIPDNFVPIAQTDLNTILHNVVTPLKEIIDTLTMVKYIKKYHISVGYDKYLSQYHRCKQGIVKYEDENIALQTRIDELLEAIKDTSNITIPCDNIMKSSCTLYTDLTGKNTQLTKKIDTLTKQLNTNKKRLLRFKQIIDNKTAVLKQFKIFTKCFQQINTIYNQNTYLYNICPISEIKHQCIDSAQPYKIIDTIRKHKELSYTYYKRQEVQKKYQELKIEFESIKKNSIQSKQIFIKMLSNKQLQLNKLNKSLATIYDELVSLKQTTNDTNEQLKIVEDDKETLDRLISNYSTTLETLDNNIIDIEKYLSKRYYKFISDQYSKLISTLDTRITYIEETLKTHEIVKIRIEEEVDKQLIKLKNKYAIVISIKNHLYKLNYIYNIEFIRTIIRDVNTIINKIFTYRIEVYSKLLDEMDTNTEIEEKDIEKLMKLSVRVNYDTEISDFSECSVSQKNIIDFAFNLAIMIKRGYVGYPIFLDELDSNLDNHHRQKLMEFLYELLEAKIVSQIFIISNTYFHEGILGLKIILSNINNIDYGEIIEDSSVKIVHE